MLASNIWYSKLLSENIWGFYTYNQITDVKQVTKSFFKPDHLFEIHHLYVKFWHWNELPWEGVKSPYLEELMSHMDVALSAMV